MRPFYVTTTALAIVAAMAIDRSAAQSPDRPSSETQYETVTVYAPLAVRRQVIDPMMSRKSSTGLELVSVSRSVSFFDLDLSDANQVRELKNRVKLAAHDACAEIDKKFPRTQYIPIPKDQDCEGNAIGGAMIAVKALEVAAARY